MIEITFPSIVSVACMHDSSVLHDCGRCMSCVIAFYKSGVDLRIMRYLVLPGTRYGTLQYCFAYHFIVFVMSTVPPVCSLRCSHAS